VEEDALKPDIAAFVVPLLAASVASIVLTGIAIGVLRRTGVVDIPNARSSHSRVTVRGAGIGVALASVLTGSVMLFVDDVPTRQMLALAVGSAAFAVLGLVDDVRSGIPARWRLVAQVVLAAAMSIGLLANLDPVAWFVIAIPAASVWIVAYVNAFNFMDGINGISGISAVVAGAADAAMGLVLDDLLLVVAGAVVAGAVLGFLPFNFPRARAFLGDVGSYFLGAWLAAVAILVVRAGGAPWSAIAPLSLYLADTGWAIICRARRGENLLAAHRSHVYQRLASGSTAHSATSIVIGTLTMVLSALGVWAVGQDWWKELTAVFITGAILVIYLGSPLALKSFRNGSGKGLRDE
jgi:UDP-GlcNAc:undecaprenyl-phosphate GlcNAc-1-phosphate transferase